MEHKACGAIARGNEVILRRGADSLLRDIPVHGPRGYRCTSLKRGGNDLSVVGALHFFGWPCEMAVFANCVNAMVIGAIRIDENRMRLEALFSRFVSSNLQTLALDLCDGRPQESFSPNKRQSQKYCGLKCRFQSFRLVKRAFPRPVPIVKTPHRVTSCMNGISLSPWTTASLCSTTDVSCSPIVGIIS